MVSLNLPPLTEDQTTKITIEAGFKLGLLTVVVKDKQASIAETGQISPELINETRMKGLLLPWDTRQWMAEILSSRKSRG